MTSRNRWERQQQERQQRLYQRAHSPSERAALNNEVVTSPSRAAPRSQDVNTLPVAVSNTFLDVDHATIGADRITLSIVDGGAWRSAQMASPVPMFRYDSYPYNSRARSFPFEPRDVLAGQQITVGDSNETCVITAPRSGRAVGFIPPLALIYEEDLVRVNPNNVTWTYTGLGTTLAYTLDTSVQMSGTIYHLRARVDRYPNAAFVYRDSAGRFFLRCQETSQMGGAMLMEVMSVEQPVYEPAMMRIPPASAQMPQALLSEILGFPRNSPYASGTMNNQSGNNRVATPSVPSLLKKVKRCLDV